MSSRELPDLYRVSRAPRQLLSAPNQALFAVLVVPGLAVLAIVGLVVAGVPPYAATLGLAGAAVIAIAVLRKRARPWLRIVQTAVAAMERGDFDAAVGTYEAALAQCPPEAKPGLVAGIAYARRRQGAFDTAIACFKYLRTACHKNEKIRRRCSGLLASTYALAGDLEGARLELDQPDGALGAGPTNQAIVLARLGDLELVPELQPTYPRGGTPAILEHERRVLALLQAFAMTQLNTYSPRQVKAKLDRAMPLRRDELDYLALDWPELRDFLARDLWPGERGALPEARVVRVHLSAGARLDEVS